MTSKMKRTDIYTLLPSDIKADWADNGSREFMPSESEIINMMDSLRKEGQLQPVVIGRDGNNIYLKMGFCRHLAMSRINEENAAAGKELMRIKCTLKNGNEEDSYRQNIVENLHRSSLSPIDIAHQIRKWQEIYGKTDEYILDLYKVGNKPRSASWLSQHKSLLNLDYDLQKRIHYGEFTFTEAVKLASLDREARKKVLNQYETDNASTEADPVAKPRKTNINKAAQSVGLKVRRTQKEVREALEMLSGGS